MKSTLGLATLLLRTSVFRRLVVVTAIATLASLAVLSMLGALSLTVEQRRVSQFGGATASVQTAISVPVGRAVIRKPSWLEDPQIQSWPTLQANVFLGGTLFDYKEVQAPSLVTEGRFTLTWGVWPNAAGQCVTNGSDQTLDPSIGVWTLQLTGQIRDEF
ncbi:MAG: hypothetical protein QM619_08755 [Micropruina sp.]|uniref:hypothetical protein n=1 Tax=Micropruina sp. TaxID=2737536 RepID=UPI0039E36E3E